jgi:hypothetical protein
MFSAASAAKGSLGSTTWGAGGFVKIKYNKK